MIKMLHILKLLFLIATIFIVVYINPENKKISDTSSRNYRTEQAMDVNNVFLFPFNALSDKTLLKCFFHNNRLIGLVANEFGKKASIAMSNFQMKAFVNFAVGAFNHLKDYRGILAVNVDGLENSKVFGNRLITSNNLLVLYKGEYELQSNKYAYQTEVIKKTGIHYLSIS